MGLGVLFASSFDAVAQERFFTSGAHVQVQVETDRNINQDISLTEIITEQTAVQAVADASLTGAVVAINTSLSTAGDVVCGNAGMILGPSHTTAVGRCIPALTLSPQGNTVLTGGLRVGSADTCDPSMEGMIRYVPSQKTMQFCDGNSWQEVGAAPASSSTFTAVTNANPSTVITSNAVQISGFAGARTATVTPGATLVVNGTAVGASASVQQGDMVALRVQSAASFDSTINVTFTVSSLVATWSVQTRSQDTTPNAFTFSSLTNQLINSQVMSSNAVVNGFEGPLAITVSGLGNPELQVNGGAWVTTASINPGNNVRLRVTNAATGNTTHGANVTLGTYSTSWLTTTESYTWSTATWGSCSPSSTCSAGASVPGTQTRTVLCVGASSSTTGSTSLCTSPTPASSQACTFICPMPSICVLRGTNEVYRGLAPAATNGDWLGNLDATACANACASGGYKYCNRYGGAYTGSSTGVCRGGTSLTDASICSGDACGCPGGGCYDRRWECGPSCPTTNSRTNMTFSAIQGQTSIQINWSLASGGPGTTRQVSGEIRDGTNWVHAYFWANWTCQDGTWQLSVPSCQALDRAGSPPDGRNIDHNTWPNVISSCSGTLLP